MEPSLGDTGIIEAPETERSTLTDLLEKEQQSDQSDLRVRNSDLENIIKSNAVIMSEKEMRAQED